MMPGTYSFPYVGRCVRTYDPVKLRLRYLYQVELELLTAHIFQTIWYIWFIFGLMIDIGPKVKVMDIDIFNVKTRGLRYLFQVEPELLWFIWFIFVMMIHTGSKVIFSNTLVHAYDLRVKVTDLEIFNI